MTLSTSGIAQECWGLELPKKSNRVKFAYTENLAPSYVPKIWIQGKDQSLKPSRQLRLSNAEKMILEFTQDIEHHVENRIQIFLQQMLLFYKTDLCFEKYFSADAQVGNNQGDGAAAHSGTLPTLRLKSDKHSSSVSVGHGTSFYYMWNTTVYLPVSVNRFDSAIDVRAGLRESAMHILNQVSVGDLSPKKGLRAFLTALTVAAQESNRNRPNIALIYERVAADYMSNLDKGSPVIQKFCLRSVTDTVNESFYLEERDGMLRQLLIKNVIVNNPLPQPSPIEWNSVKAVVLAQLEQFSAETGSAGRTYIRTCVVDSTGNVKSAALQYLKYLQPFTEKKSKHLIGFLSDTNKEISSPGIDLRKAILEVIKNAYNTASPRKIPFILTSVFYEINEGAANCNLDSSKVAGTPSGKVVTKVKELIQEKITSLSGDDTKTVAEHIKTCKKSAEINFVATRVFNSLLVMDEFSQRQIIYDISITNTAKGRSSVKEIVSEFYSAVNGVMPKAKKINYIILRVLLESNISGS